MKSDKEHRIDKDNVACVCKEDLVYIVIDISNGHRELKFRSKD